LGKVYEHGEIIISQGEVGDCMYVVQQGQVEVFVERSGKEIQLAVRGEGEFFGEMAIFEREVRSASVRAVGPARLLTIDKGNFLRRIHEDPVLALRITEMMSSRIRELSVEVSRLKNGSD
jgi:CRP-like cAMP-binding protein